MIPESKLIESELVIRALRLPEDVLLTRKSTIRWLALSLGLINPNESRTVLVDLLDTLIEFHYAGKNPTTRDILEKMHEKTGEEQNPKAVYYHLQRLIDMGILTRRKGEYSFGDGDEKNLALLFRRIYESKINAMSHSLERALSRLSQG
ncbi:MAG: hypothetical protein QXT05_02930 [Candidatus Bilamarchaeaceae archaeon]